MAFSDGITSLSDLQKKIIENEALFFTIAPEIIKSLDNLVYEYDSGFVKAVYDSAHISYVKESLSEGKEQIHKNLHLVMRAYSSKLTYIGSAVEEDFMDVMCFLMTDSNLLDKIEVSEDTYRKLYRFLIDSYIVSEYAYELVIFAVKHQLYHNYQIENNTDIQEDLKNLPDPTSVMILCRYIQELNADDEKRKDLCFALGTYVNTDVMYRKVMYDLIDRYGATIPDVELEIVDIAYHMNRKDPFNYQLISSMCSLYRRMTELKENKVNPKICQLFISEVAEKLVPLSHIDPGDYANAYRVLKNTIMAHHFKVPNLEDLEKKYTQYYKKLYAINMASQTGMINSTPIEKESLESEMTDEEATEASHKLSGAMDKIQHKIYDAFKNYKDHEDQVDNQLTKLVTAMKKMVTGDTRAEVIEGKKFSVLGIFKKVLATAAIFSYSKVGLICVLLVRYTLRKKTMKSERKKIMQEIEVELQLIDEKIDDARGDRNRKAKYALMRTRAELQKTLEKIKYGMETDEKMTAAAHKVLDDARK